MLWRWLPSTLGALAAAGTWLAVRSHDGLPVTACFLALGAFSCLLRRVGTRPWHGWLASFFLAMLAAMSLICLGERLADSVVNRHLHVLLSPLLVNPMEGREALKAWLAWRGENLYSPLHGYPYLLTLYGPVYYYIAGAFASLAGPGLLSARLVSLCAFLAVAASVFFMVGKATGRRFPAGLAVALLMVNGVMESGTMARPDMFAWAAFFGATALLVAGERSSPGPRQWPSALLIAGLYTVGLFSKQLTWPLVGVAVALSPALRGWRFAVKLGLLLAGMTLAGLWTAQTLTHGMFWKQILLYPQAMTRLGAMNSNLFAWERLHTYWVQEYALVILWGVNAAWTIAERRLWLPDILLPVFLPVLFLVLRWTGAEYNHFIPVAVILCCGTGILLGRLGRRSTALLFGALLIVAPWRTSTFLETEHANARKRAAESMDKLAFLNSASAGDGPILCDTESGYLALGHDAIMSRMKFYDAFELAVAAKTGLWQPGSSQLYRDLANRTFSLAAKCQNFQPEAVEILLRFFYRPLVVAAKAELATRDDADGSGVIIDPGQPPITSQDLTLKVVGMDNLAYSGSCLSIEDQTRPGFLDILVEGGRAAGTVTSRFWPRMNRSNPSASMRLEAGGRTMDVAPPQAGEGWSPVWAGPVGLSFEQHGPRTLMRLRLEGESQLWLDAEHPMAFEVAAEAR